MSKDIKEIGTQPRRYLGTYYEIVYVYTHTHTHIYGGASQVALVIKNLPANAGDIRDTGLTPGL